MPMVQTTETAIYRDTKSKALLSTDVAALKNHRQARRIATQTKIERETVTNRVTELTNKLDQFEVMIQNLTQQITVMMTGRQ